MLFVIPWGRHWIIGTTDTDWYAGQGPPGRASAADIDYLLDHVNAVLEQPLTRDDVEGVYAGLRPLLSGESESTSKLSREHAVAHPVPGLVVVAGGKYTTYRVMAKDAVDAAVHGLRREGAARRSPTSVPLLGADGYAALWNAAHAAGPALRACTWRGSSTCSDRYGSLIDEVLELVAADPTLGEPLAGRAGLPAGRGRLRGLARGRPAPRRRAGPAHPDLDRDVRPRRRRGAGGGAAGGAGAGLERRAGRSARSSTTASGSRPSGRASACPTTRPPTPPGWAPPTSSPELNVGPGFPRSLGKPEVPPCHEAGGTGYPGRTQSLTLPVLPEPAPR